MRGEPLGVQQDDQTYVLFSVLPPGGLLEHELMLDDLVGIYGNGGSRRT